MGLITEACFALATGCLGHCTTNENSPSFISIQFKMKNEGARTYISFYSCAHGIYIFVVICKGAMGHAEIFHCSPIRHSDLTADTNTSC